MLVSHTLLSIYRAQLLVIDFDKHVSKFSLMLLKEHSTVAVVVRNTTLRHQSLGGERAKFYPKAI